MKRSLSRSRAAHARLLVYLVASVASTGCATRIPESPTPPEPAPTAPATPFFTAEQATRGQRIFSSICATCHGRNEFAGPIFAITWRAEPLGALYQQVSNNMPQNRPGSLTPQQYVDVVSYILQLNGVQPGDRELPVDPALLARMEW